MIYFERYVVLPGQPERAMHAVALRAIMQQVGSDIEGKGPYQVSLRKDERADNDKTFFTLVAQVEPIS